jgi:hypothetical protein
MPEKLDVKLLHECMERLSEIHGTSQSREVSPALLSASAECGSQKVL